MQTVEYLSYELNRKEGAVFDTIEEAFEAIVTKQEAKTEIENHGCRWADFVAEVGEKEEYKGAEVLEY